MSIPQLKRSQTSDRLHGRSLHGVAVVALAISFALGGTAYGRPATVDPSVSAPIQPEPVAAPADTRAEPPVAAVVDDASDASPNPIDVSASTPPIAVDKEPDIAAVPRDAAGPGLAQPDGGAPVDNAKNVGRLRADDYPGSGRVKRGGGLDGTGPRSLPGTPNQNDASSKQTPNDASKRASNGNSKDTPSNARPQPAVHGPASTSPPGQQDGTGGGRAEQRSSDTPADPPAAPYSPVRADPPASADAPVRAAPAASADAPVRAAPAASADGPAEHPQPTLVDQAAPDELATFEQLPTLDMRFHSAASLTAPMPRSGAVGLPDERLATSRHGTASRPNAVEAPATAAGSSVALAPAPVRRALEALGRDHRDGVAPSEVTSARSDARTQLDRSGGAGSGGGFSPSAFVIILCALAAVASLLYERVRLPAAVMRSGVFVSPIERPD